MTEDVAHRPVLEIEITEEMIAAGHAAYQVWLTTDQFSQRSFLEPIFREMVKAGKIPYLVAPPSAEGIGDRQGG